MYIYRARCPKLLIFNKVSAHCMKKTPCQKVEECLRLSLQGVYTTTSVPYTILSILALVGALLTWLLPETHNTDLSDKLDCTEMIYAEATEKKSLTVQEQILAYETSI